MKLATTTNDFDRYSDSYPEKIRWVAEAGFRHIDLSLYTIKEGDRLFGEDWQEELREIKSLAADLGVDFVQSHAPNVNPLSPDIDPAVNDFQTERAIRVCGALEIPLLVIHGGHDPSVYEREPWFEKNRDYFKKFLPLLEETGVNLLFENTAARNMGSRYFPISGRDLRDFCRYMDHPLVHACWDTGHANMEGNQYQEILDLGEDFYAVHFNDNRGELDEHLLPFMGTLNVDEVFAAMEAVDFKGPLTFESGAVFRGFKYWLGNRRKFRDTAPEPALAMQQALEKVFFETGKYLLESHGLPVE